MDNKNNAFENKERYMKLFLIFIVLLVIDTFIPDPIPIVDELVLGGGTLLNAIKAGKAVKIYKSIVRAEQAARRINPNKCQNKLSARKNINSNEVTKELKKLDNFR